MASSPSSYIKTVGAVDTRTADSLTLPFLARPQAMTIYTRHVALGTEGTNDSRLWTVGGATFTAPYLLLQISTANYAVFHASIAAAANVNSATPIATYGQMVELCAQLYSDGSVQIHKSVDGGTIVSGTQSAAKPLAQTWAAATIIFNHGTGGSAGFTGIRNLKAVRGVFDLQTMRRKAGVTF